MNRIQKIYLGTLFVFVIGMTIGNYYNIFYWHSFLFRMLYYLCILIWGINLGLYYKRWFK